MARPLSAYPFFVVTTQEGTDAYEMGAAVGGTWRKALDCPGIGTGDRIGYVCVDDLENPTNREVGEGIVTAGDPPTLSRVVEAAEGVDATGPTDPIPWGAGTKYIFGFTPRPVSLDADGQLDVPGQSAVAAYNSSSDANQTGNGETPTVDLDTEIFDTLGEFAADTFTATVAGRYLACAGIYITGLTSSHTQAAFYVTASNRRYEFFRGNPGAMRGAGANQVQLNGAVVVDMDAGDTLTLGCQVENGSTVVAIGTGNSTLHVTYLQVTKLP